MTILLLVLKSDGIRDDDVVVCLFIFSPSSHFSIMSVIFDVPGGQFFLKKATSVWCVIVLCPAHPITTNTSVTSLGTECKLIFRNYFLFFDYYFLISLTLYPFLHICVIISLSDKLINLLICKWSKANRERQDNEMKFLIANELVWMCLFFLSDETLPYQCLLFFSPSHSIHSQPNFFVQWEGTLLMRTLKMSLFVFLTLIQSNIFRGHLPAALATRRSQLNDRLFFVLMFPFFLLLFRWHLSNDANVL